MDIYLLLSSKPHNPHYLNKYTRFIRNCQLKNQGYTGYTERHHICPKAIDMFPEYSSFIYHPWNCAVLTARQHFIAHMLLWKVYNNDSMTRAFGVMSNYYSIKSSRIYQNIKQKYSKVVSKQMKNTVTVRKEDGTCMRISKEEFDKNEQVFGSTKGMTYAVNNKGDGFYVKKDDLRFKTGELKGNNADTITITDGKTNKRINPNDNIPLGWYRGMSKDSPKGSTWINNGKTSKMFKGDQIPKGWVKGRLFKTKPKHVGSIGKIWVTNGDQSKMINPHEVIPQGWKRGRSFSN